MITFNIKSWAVIFVFFAVLFIWDVNGRLNFSTDYSKKQSNQIAKISIIDTKISDRERKQILDLYKRYDQKAKAKKIKSKANTIVKKGLSVAEQGKQNGLLDKFYVDNNKYILKGIFTEQKHFAVLFRENVSTGAIDEYKVEVGQKLGSYLVSEITYSQIKFTLNESTVVLSIF